MSLAFENPKDPADTANYSFEWIDLISIEDPILDHQVRVVTGEVPALDDQSDLRILSSTVKDQTVIAMISGGTAGQTYRVECEITLTSRQVFNREAKLKVKNL